VGLKLTFGGYGVGEGVRVTSADRDGRFRYRAKQQQRDVTNSGSVYQGNSLVGAINPRIGMRMRFGNGTFGSLNAVRALMTKNSVDGWRNGVSFGYEGRNSSSPPDLEARFSTFLTRYDYQSDVPPLIDGEPFLGAGTKKVGENLFDTTLRGPSGGIGFSSEPNFDIGARFAYFGVYDRLYTIGTEITDPTGPYGGLQVPFVSGIGCQDPTGGALWWNNAGGGPFAFQTVEVPPLLTGLPDTREYQGVQLAARYRITERLALEGSWTGATLDASNNVTGGWANRSEQAEDGSTATSNPTFTGTWWIGDGFFNMATTDGRTYRGLATPDRELIYLADITGDGRQGLLAMVPKATTTPSPGNQRLSRLKFRWADTFPYPGDLRYGGTQRYAYTTTPGIVGDVGFQYEYRGLDINPEPTLQQFFFVPSFTPGPNGRLDLSNTSDSSVGFISPNGQWLIQKSDEVITPRTFRLAVGFRF
jgi:hypothetical protein